MRDDTRCILKVCGLQLFVGLCVILARIVATFPGIVLMTAAMGAVGLAAVVGRLHGDHNPAARPSSPKEG